MRIAISHQIGLDLGHGVSRAIQQILLTPRSGPTQTVQSWAIEMNGLSKPFTDAFGNIMHLANQAKPEGEQVIKVTGSVETHDRNGIVGRMAEEPTPALFKRITPLTKSAPNLYGNFRAMGQDPTQRIDLLHGLMRAIGDVYSFLPQYRSLESYQEQQGQTQSLEKPPLSAEDFAHCFIGAARALDIPARFVRGYFVISDSEPAVFHSWAEAWDEKLGWIAFDAALGYCPADRHLRVSIGLDSASAMPIRCVPDPSSILTLDNMERTIAQ